MNKHSEGVGLESTSVITFLLRTPFLLCLSMSTFRLPISCVFKTAPPSRTSCSFQNAIPRSCALVRRPASAGSVKSVSKAFGLKSSSFKVSAATYKVKLISLDGEETEFDAPDDAYILDSAEAAGVDIPYSCRVGACSSCVGQLVSGYVDQSDGSLLTDKQKEEGFLLTCVSYPKSDCVIHALQEDALF